MAVEPQQLPAAPPSPSCGCLGFRKPDETTQVLLLPTNLCFLVGPAVASCGLLLGYEGRRRCLRSRSHLLSLNTDSKEA